MKKCKRVISIFVLVIMFVSICCLGYSFFTDYQVKQIQAEGGVSLELRGDDGIAHTVQTGYKVIRNNKGWYKKGTQSNVSATVRTGYTFNGWYDGSTKVSSNTSFTYSVTKPTVLEAKTGATSYTISAELDGGLIGGSNTWSTKYTIKDSVTLPTPTKKGYTFLGWVEKGTTNAPNKSYIIPVGSTGNKTFIAKWEINKYRFDVNANVNDVEIFSNMPITFDVYLDGVKVKTGVNDYVNDSVTYGTRFELRNIRPYTGYRIVATSGGDFSNNSITGTISKDTAVYFRLYRSYNNIITHLMSGLKNGEGSNPAKDCYQVGDTRITKEYKSTYTISSSNAVKIPKGCRLANVFRSNSLASSGEWTSYPYSTSITQKSGQMSYEMFYVPETYNITYNLDGGTNSTSNPKTYNVLYGVSLKAPTKANHTFTGWYLPNGTKVTGINEGKKANFTSAENVYSELASRTTGDITLTARYALNKHRVTFNANGGSVSPTYKDVSHGQSYGELPIPTRTGHTFLGWFTSATGGTQVTTTTKATANATVYAHWKINTYRLSYNANGGNVSTPYKDIVYGSTYGTLPVPTRTGHIFLGWFTSATGGTQVSDTTKIGAGNVTIYAHWRVNSYTYNIKYVSSSGKALGTSTISGNYGSSATATPPDKTGYTKPASQTVRFDSTTAKTYTFIYNPIRYNIKYHYIENNKSNPDSYTIESNTIILNNPTKTGNTFLGWQDGLSNEQKMSVIIPTGSTGDKEYIATWQINTLDVNALIDGTLVTSELPITFDVYINNELISENVNDFQDKSITWQSTYDIRNIKVEPRYKLVGIMYDDSYNGGDIQGIVDDNYKQVNFILKTVPQIKKTVLYSDGTLVMDEPITDRGSNTSKHGAVIKEYPSLEEHGYVFNSPDEVLWNDNITAIGTVEVNKDMHPTSTAYWFTAMDNFTSGNLSELDVSNVTNMDYMFANIGMMSYSFNVGDLSKWNVSNVKSMRGMFSNACRRNAWTFDLGDLSNWDVSNVTDMSEMFDTAARGVQRFNIGNLSKWNVSKVTNMSNMFRRAGYNASIFNIGDLSGWNTGNVTDMSNMFSNTAFNASSFSLGNLGSWNTSNVTTMVGMFDNAGRSASTFYIGDLSKWNVSNVTNMASMFNCAGYNASTFNIGNLGNWNTSKVTDMSYMFSYAGFKSSSFNVGNLSGWNVHNCTNYSRFCDGIASKLPSGLQPKFGVKAIQSEPMQELVAPQEIMDSEDLVQDESQSTLEFNKDTDTNVQEESNTQLVTEPDNMEDQATSDSQNKIDVQEEPENQNETDNLKEQDCLEESEAEVTDE